MKQLIQNYKSGELQLVEVPDPIIRPNGIILNTVNSLISVGTEKLMIDLAKKGYLGKALARPDLVKQVINKIKVDGIVETYKASMSRLDSPVTLGYSSSGTIAEVGEGLNLKQGERIACFGDGFATHSEKSYVPKNMFVNIPDGVTFEEASFVGLGSIALNAIRLANLTFGESVAVIGLGLLGQLAVQMLKAFGIRVIGIDISESKTKMATDYGCDSTAVIGKDDVNQVVSDFTSGIGADAVIIMAGSKDNKPIELAAEISRDHGRIVACGMVSLDVPRQEFFKKELSVIVSRATGPGKFDSLYENKGIDYPLPYVRWTTQRNMDYFLKLVKAKKIDLSKLISHRYKIEDALQAYEMILKGEHPYLGVLLEYPSIKESSKTEKVKINSFSADNSIKQDDKKTKIGIGLIGAGLHANTSILPSLRNNKAIKLVGIADAEGFKGLHTGKKYEFEYCVADYKKLLEDNNIDAVLISTRHNLHAKMIIDSLKSGKHVFVEKPLAMNEQELGEVISVYNAEIFKKHLCLMVGFNRRFAPFSQKAKILLGETNNAVINCRVNAGFVPKESWVHSSDEGGGRVIGEVCHFVDLIQYLAGSLIKKVYAERTQEKGEDNIVITLSLENGSIATILYASQGDRLLPRERFEVFSGNSACVIDNFKSLFFAKSGKSRKNSSFNIDRGYNGEFQAFVNSILSQNNPVSINEYINTTQTTFAVLKSIKTKNTVEI